jgi:Fe-S oxidoreductase
VREAAATGAEVILSPCAGCISALESAALSDGMATDDVIAPLARSLGVEHDNRLAGILAGEDVGEILARAAGGLWEEPRFHDRVVRSVESIVARRTN